MADGPTDGAASSASTQSKSTRAAFLTTRNIAIGIGALVLLVVVVVALRYRGGNQRRRYESLLTTSLDRIVTAEEGFYYDSTRYVASLRALPTVTLPAGVHVTLYSPDRRSWWGVATHDRLPTHHCVVWVGTAPASLPSQARAPENETKPLCFDDKGPVVRQASRS
jgi:hypothetical protein